MTDLLKHNLAPLMFVGLIVGMGIGYPAAFSIAAIGLGFSVIGIGPISQLAHRCYDPPIQSCSINPV